MRSQYEHITNSTAHIDTGSKLRNLHDSVFYCRECTAQSSWMMERSLQDTVNDEHSQGVAIRVH